MKTEIPGEYSTADLYFAAYLQTAGVRMIRTDKQGAGKLLFVFDVSLGNLEELKASWFNQSGKVSGLLFANAIKSLKHICHMP